MPWSGARFRRPEWQRDHHLGCKLPPAELARQRHRHVALSRDVDGNWLITAEAELIDVVPLRRNLGIGKGRPVSFDILAERSSSVTVCP